MKKKKTIGTALITTSLILGLSACVDHDYDLSKDIDLTVAIGGDATLPGSSTELYSLDQLLNLSSGSAIKAVNEGDYGLSAGDYVLTQTAASTASTVEINKVTINTLQGNAYRTHLDAFFNIPGVEYVSAPVNNAQNTIDISDNNVDPALKSLKNVRLEMPMEFSIGYESQNYAGTARIDQGFRIEFNPVWRLIITDPVTASYARIVDGHTLEFTKDGTFTNKNPLVVKLSLTEVDLTKLPSDQGLYAPGKFRINSDILSNGKISLRTADIPSGSSVALTLVTSTKINKAVILSATGRFDPKINIASTSFNITGIPDFLKGEGNRLDIDNPQIYLNVNNPSPVAVEVNALLTAFKDTGEYVTVGVGAAHGTSPIVLEANANSIICLSRTGTAAGNATTTIAVPDLDQLITTVPYRIDVTNIKANAVDRDFTIEFGQKYIFTTGYDVVVPLQFGADLKLIYNTDVDDWGSDLKKYNFKQAVASLDVINTVPLDMVPSVTPIDADGNEINGISVTVEGMVNAGMINAPATSHLTINLASNVENLSQLDGVRIEFTGTTGSGFVGQALNQNQYIKFENIKIGIRGGVIVDLN